MKAISEIDLPYLPFEDKTFREDPFRYFSAARRQHPWLAKCSFAYVLTEHAAIRDIMAHDGNMGVGFGESVDLLGAGETRWGQFVKRSVQTQVGEQHQRLRGAVARAFTPREANRHRKIMREQVLARLATWAAKQSGDFEQFAAGYPVSVMCRIIGASLDAVAPLQSSLEVLGLGGSFDSSLVPKLEKSFLVMDEFVRELVAERRSHEHTQTDDLLDGLLLICDEGDLSEEELYNLLVFLFIGGYDTSKNVLITLMHILIDHPEIYQRCATDLDYCRKVVNETFRFQGVASSPRVLSADIEFREVFMPKGTMLFIPWSISGRDPGSFKNPDQFDPLRKGDAPTMPFGLGPHMCLGQFLARAQIEEGLHIIAQHIKNPRRAGEHGWREFVGVWGLRGLPIEFDFLPVSDS